MERILFNNRIGVLPRSSLRHQRHGAASSGPASSDLWWQPNAVLYRQTERGTFMHPNRFTNIVIDLEQKVRFGISIT